MRTLTQKSKKPADSNGKFQYIFSYISDSGKESEIIITAATDNEAKLLAEEEINNGVKTNIRDIIDDHFNNPFKLLINPSFSNEENIVVSFFGSSRWFNIPSSVIKEIRPIGQAVFEGNGYPTVVLKIKDSKPFFESSLLKLKWAIINEESDFELPEFDYATNVIRLVREKELSGPKWVARYPGSSSVSDLASPFKENVESFITALQDAGASVSISATYRPTERAYLMQTAFDIAAETIPPSDAPEAPTGVNIEWVHPKLEDSIKAAKKMVTGYGIVYRPAYPTKHSEKTAIDMNISWSGTLNVKQANGTVKAITSTPRDNGNTDLHAVGRTYSVYKLVSDKPHWSDDGH